MADPAVEGCFEKNKFVFRIYIENETGLVLVFIFLGGVARGGGGGHGGSSASPPPTMKGRK